MQQSLFSWQISHSPPFASYPSGPIASTLPFEALREQVPPGALREILFSYWARTRYKQKGTCEWRRCHEWRSMKIMLPRKNNNHMICPPLEGLDVYIYIYIPLKSNRESCMNLDFPEKLRVSDMKTPLEHSPTDGFPLSNLIKPQLAPSTKHYKALPRATKPQRSFNKA